MLNLKLWLRTALEKLLVCRLSVATDIIQWGGDHELEIIIPHRLNWPLLNATVRAFDRLTSGDFGITVVVNFADLPDVWAGMNNPHVTLVRNRVTTFGKIFRTIFNSENGSLGNALGLERGLAAHTNPHWAFMAHSDSAPLVKGWNEIFFRAMGKGLVIGNIRDTFRVFAAHGSGTIFQAQEFRKRGGSVQPLYRFGKMIHDVGDGVTLALHSPGEGLVPVLPNNRQSPELSSRLKGILGDFAQNGTHVSFDPESGAPIFAHMGRGTPRSEGAMAQKLPVDYWIEYLETLR
jgi:hypothetical protein